MSQDGPTARDVLVSGKTPYLGLWIDEGCYNTVSTVALEPASGYFDSLDDGRSWTNARPPAGRVS